MEKFIYFDNAATTRPSKKALDYAEKFNNEYFYNPSALYAEGVFVHGEIESARKNILSHVSDNFDLIFTSCGSESDNTVIYSYAKRGNSVTTLGEHSAVYEPFVDLKNKGYDSRFAQLNQDGSVNVDNLLSLIDKNTVLVSVVHVNNETGAINDINKIAKLVKQINPRVIFHSDGVQAFGKIIYNLSSVIDLYSISAHKINALKGVGALLKNKKIKNLKAYIIGGGQESNFRSGTENTFGIKVFEYATMEHFSTIKEDYLKVSSLKDYLISNVDKNIFKVISSNQASPYVISLSAVGLKGEIIMHKLEDFGIIIGTGSACSSKHRHSRVLKSAGYSEDVLDGVIRISFSNETTIKEVEYLVEKLNLCAKELKRTMIK